MRYTSTKSLHTGIYPLCLFFSSEMSPSHCFIRINVLNRKRYSDSFPPQSSSWIMEKLIVFVPHLIFSWDDTVSNEKYEFSMCSHLIDQLFHLLCLHYVMFAIQTCIFHLFFLSKRRLPFSSKRKIITATQFRKFHFYYGNNISLPNIRNLWQLVKLKWKGQTL